MIMRQWMGLIVGALLISGCGYTTGNLLPSNYRRISIEPFQNKVAYLNENERGLYIPLLEVRAHDAIVNRFQIDGHLKISKSDQADLILKGSLVSFDRDDIRLSDSQSVDQYRLRITLALTMIDTATGKELWTESGFSGEANYFTSGAQAKSEDAALQDALTDLSRRVVERTLEDW
jgi:hypothetical protein